MTDTSPIDLLDRALAQSTQLVTSVAPDQLELQTPCADWMVRDLMRHMVGGLHNFRATVAGEPMQSFDAVVDDDALAGEFRQEAAGLIAAWREDGALDRKMKMFGGEMPAEFPLGLHITETALHSWDLATAIGRTDALDDEIAEFALAFAQKNMGPERRGAAFGPPIEAPDGAPAYERLAAFTGREAAAGA
jgi:uncharacterized protein (TIGR03086 family)